ncbi:MAG: DNA-binding Lrp family transcriptional regulator [Alteromonadaceae bacterium]|jgi:DNA-binding Lrp family transcriptional regulator
MLDKTTRVVLDNSTPSIKYFLIKWLQEFGSSAPVNNSVIDISNALGVSKDVVTKATDYFTTNGLFEKEIVLITKSWSRYSFKFSSKLHKMITGVGDGKTSHHATIIKHLLVADIQKRSGSRKLKRHSLDLAPRLLLIILLRNANECGVVDQLGLSELGRLTGMTKESVKSRIKHLMKKGYIRSYIAGVTGSYMYHRSPGIIYLNLKNPNYVLEQKIGITTCIQSEIERTNPIESIAMYNVAGEILHSQKQKFYGHEKKMKIKRLCRDRLFFHSIPEDFVELAPFFIDKPMYSKVRSFMQAKVNGYASLLLSSHWQELLKGDDIDPGVVKEQIITDTFGDKFDIEGDKGEFPSKAQKESLANVLFETSMSLAKRLQGQLIKSAHVNFGEMNHVILPVLDDVNYRIYLGIDSFFKVDNKFSRNKYLTINVGQQEPERVAEDPENEISKEDEYRCGLLTKQESKTIYMGGKTISI